MLGIYGFVYSELMLTSEKMGKKTKKLGKKV